MKTINLDKKIKLSPLEKIINNERNILDNELERKKIIYNKKNNYQLSLFGISMSLTRFIGKVSLRVLLFLLCIIGGGGSFSFSEGVKKEKNNELLGNKVDDDDIFRSESALKENMFLEMPASFDAIRQFKNENGVDALNSILYVNNGKITYGNLKNYNEDWLISYKDELNKLNELEKIS